MIDNDIAQGSIPAYLVDFNDLFREALNGC